MKIYKFCKQYLLSQKANLILFVLLAFFGSLVSLISPYVLGDFIDKLIAGIHQSAIVQFCLFLGAISIFKIFKDYATSVLYTKMQNKMGYELNMHVIKHVQRLSLSFLNDKDVAYLNQRINGDSYAIISFCLTTLRDMTLNIILIVAPLFVLLSLNVTITIIMLFFVLLYVAIYYLLKRAIYNAGFAFREGQSRFFASLFEQIEHLMRIKIDSVQSEFNERSARSFSSYYKTAIKSQRVNFIYSGIDGIIATFAQIALLAIGGIQIIRGEFTIGMFTIFNSYFRIMLSACRYFFGLAANYQTTLVSYNRTEEVLNHREESNGKFILSDIEFIKVSNIDFSYETYNYIQTYEKSIADTKIKKTASHVHINDDAKYVVDDFSYVFTKGNIYVLKGKNGTGKTTLIKLLIGLYEDERSGNIYYNDIPIEQIDMIQARKTIIGYAEQEPLLSEGSIYYNITYKEYAEAHPYDDSAFDHVDDVCVLNQFAPYIKILNMDNFFKEKAPSFLINGNSSNLSGGEKQKLAILKVMYKNPTVMIFDEPTSALDVETKKRFLRYIEQIKEDKIIIIVTHDNAFETLADHVIEVLSK